MPAQTFKAPVVHGFKTWALPRLTELPDTKWDEEIQKAQAIEFDGVERIVVGKHGSNIAEELRLGSMTKHVLAESQCDMLVNGEAREVPREAS